MINKKFFRSSVLLLVLIFAPVSFADAADLIVSPSSQSVEVGSTFSFSLLVNSGSENINAISSVIKYPTDRIQVLGISTNNSKVGFWVQEPEFSNVSGEINLEGVVMSPGFTGIGGNIITVTARASGPGSANLDLSSGVVLANDGSGTNVLDNLIDGSVSIQSAIEIPVVETPVVEEEEEIVSQPTVSGDLPSELSIKSSTHPDSDKWYSNSEPVFSWNVTSDIDAVRTLVGEFPNSEPTVVYSPPIGERDVQDMPDGVWYFHLQGRSSEGWGDVSHFKFNVDTTDPEYFDMNVLDNDDLTDPVIVIELDAEDETSGIDHYSIEINNQFVDELSGDTEVFRTSPLKPGDHTIKISAVDAAGNSLTKSETVFIKEIESPTVDEYPTGTISIDEDIVISGTSPYKNGHVLIGIKHVDFGGLLSNVSSYYEIVEENEEETIYKVPVDENGNYIFVYEEMEEIGKYSFWLVAVDERGARSIPLDGYEFTCIDTFGFEAGEKIIDIFVIIISIIALVILLWFIISWFRYKMAIMKKKQSRLKRDPAHLLHHELELLQTNIESHLALLDRIHRGTKLTAKDLRTVSKVMNQLKKMEISIQTSLSDKDKVKSVPVKSKTKRKSTAKKKTTSSKTAKTKKNTKKKVS